MVRSSRRNLARAVLLVAWTCASGSRHVAGGPQDRVRTAPLGVAPRRRALSRGMAWLLVAAPLPAGAQFTDIQAEFGFMDSDGDGLASKQEFIFRGRRILESIGTTDEEEIVHGLRQMSSQFEQADLNRDGKLDLNEMEYLMCLAETEYRRAEGTLDDGAHVQRVFDKVDVDKNGRISEEELALAMSGHGKIGAAAVHETFTKSDLDGDNGLDVWEMQYASWRLKRIAEAGTTLPDSLVRALFHLVDTNMDGKIEESEVAKAAETGAADGMSSPILPVALQKARDHFDYYDADGDGSWDSEEALGFAGFIINHQQQAYNDGGL